MKTRTKHLPLLWIMSSEWIPQFEIAWLNAIFGWRHSCGFALSSWKTEKRCCFSASLFSRCLICCANSDDNERSVRSFGSAPAGNRHVKLSKSSTCSHCAAADNYSTWLGLHSFSPEFSQVNCTQSTTHDSRTPVDIQQSSVSMTASVCEELSH